MKKLAGCEEAVAEFIALARRLGPSLGPLLYQLPPSLKRDDQRLGRFLALLPGDLQHVVEFRSSDWYDPEVLALLDQNDAGFVVHDLVGLASPRWASGGTAYVRFHGTGGKYRGRYRAEKIAGWAKWLAEQRAAGRSAWAYFNNDIGGDAIEDAKALKMRVAGDCATADAAT